MGALHNNMQTGSRVMLTMLHLQYSRGKLFLHEDNLTLSEDCVEFLRRRLGRQERLKEFYRRYGTS